MEHSALDAQSSRSTRCQAGSNGKVTKICGASQAPGSLAVHLSSARRSKTTAPATAAHVSSGKDDDKDDDKDGSSLAAAWARSHRSTAPFSVVTAATAALNFSFGAIVPVLPQYALGLGLGSSGVGLVLAAPAFARVCLNSPFGKLADSRGRRPLMIFGEAAAACGVALTGAAPTATTMVAARLLVGAGGSAANVAARPVWAT